MSRGGDLLFLFCNCTTSSKVQQHTHIRIGTIAGICTTSFFLSLLHLQGMGDYKAFGKVLNNYLINQFLFSYFFIILYMYLPRVDIFWMVWLMMNMEQKQTMTQQDFLGGKIFKTVFRYVVYSLCFWDLNHCLSLITALFKIVLQVPERKRKRFIGGK